MKPRLTLQRAIIGALAAALLAGIVPAGIVLDRRLAAALEQRARDDLALAPRLFADRVAATSDAMMMHAKDLAHAPGLAEAVASGDRALAIRLVEDARATLGGGDAVLVGPNGDSWLGPHVDAALIARTRAGEMPVELSASGTTISNFAVAPVSAGQRWTGAAGLVSPMDSRAAEALSGLTRSGVVVLSASGPTATTLDSTSTRAIARAAADGQLSRTPVELLNGRRRMIAVSAPLDGVGSVVFARFLDEELAVLPQLRRVAALSTLAALLVALVLGAIFAERIANPVQELSTAAAAVERGEFAAPLPTSRVREVDAMSTSFDSMRRALAARLEELRAANAALVDRNARLTALQSDLMQRDRLGAVGRHVAQLAHEIRNPIASLRNCLELIRRRVKDDPEAREFADLAIDELLRMHELAEQMLDLNRPRDPGAQRCRPVLVGREVARLSIAGAGSEALEIDIDGDDQLEAAIAPDALKQVLLNLVQNAREAFETWSARPAGPARVELVVSRGSDDVHIDARDNGPGIPAEILSRVFDPFFTTKDVVHGVGLGLFVAEGLVRSAGGRITAANIELSGAGAAAELHGAWFRIQLPIATPSSTVSAHPAHASA
ncbi:MAG TPA: ATP-binding protein [Gemmatimonadaceae bacterium]|nr:ATP-binding protein [Gemmatimonadaceae bacterium]